MLYEFILSFLTGYIEENYTRKICLKLCNTTIIKRNICRRINVDIFTEANKKETICKR